MRRRHAVLPILVGLLGVGLGAGPAIGSSQSEGEPAEAAGLRVVGRLPVLSPSNRAESAEGWDTEDASLILSPMRRRAYQTFRTTQGTSIQSFDLDSLQPLGSFSLTFRSDGTRSGADIPQGAAGTPSQEHMFALDESTNTLFFPIHETDAQYPRYANDILVLDLDRIDAGRADALVTRIQIPLDMTELETGQIKGLTIYQDPLTQRKKLLIYFLRTPSPSFVAQWDLDRALAASRQGRRDGYGDWRYSLANCRGAGVIPRTAVPVFRSTQSDYVYTICNVGTPAAGLVTAVVRIPLGIGGLPIQGQEEIFPGPRETSVALFDPQTDRISLVNQLTASGGGTGQTLWTFDGPSGRYVGAVGVSVGELRDGLSFGIDQSTGRVYVLGPNQRIIRSQGVETRFFTVQGGVMLIDQRLTPTPQALLFPEFARKSDVAIRVDPGTADRPTRVFVRRAFDQEAANPRKPPEGAKDCEWGYPSEGSAEKTEAEQDCGLDDQYYLVLEDTVTYGEQPELADQDRFTVNAVERPGITDSNFEAAGSAYAARLRLVGGLREGAARVCSPDEREYSLGWTEEVRLSNLDVGARAVGLGADSTTRLDAERPAQRCGNRSGTPAQEIDQLLSRPWPVHATECAGDSQAHQRLDEIPLGAGVTSDVVCDQSSLRAVGRAGTRAFDGATLASPEGPADVAGIRIGDASSEVSTYRDPVRGVVVRIEAVVRDVEIPVPEGGGDPVRITLAKSVAESWSNGRPAAGERVSFERVICLAGGGSVPEGGCYKSQDDDSFRSLVEEISRRLGGNVSIRIPQPDAALKQGSPGGYVAGIQKAIADQVDDKLLNGDASLEVPAIEIVRFADTDDAKVRQIIRLAAVRATTTYGIFLLPQGGGFPIDPVLPGLPLPPIQPPLVGSPDSDLGPTSGEQVTGSGPTFVPGGGPVVFGLRIRPIGETALGAVVWLALALPFYLAWRRDWLIRWFGREAG